MAKAIASGESPMPFGCVAFEAMGTKGATLNKKLKSPMPFGCVAFEAESGRKDAAKKVLVSNAFRLCGL